MLFVLFRKSKWRATKCNDMSPLLQFHQRCCCFSQPLQDRNNEGMQTSKKMKVTEKSKKHACFTFESVWISFLATPHKWYDCRVIKSNQSAPDFICIDTGKGLWIESKYTPLWVKTKLSSLNSEVFAPSTTQSLWKVLFVNPSKWFDYRKIKKSRNHPDFVHKYSRNRLWIEDVRTPAWARLMLDNLQDEVFAPSTSVEKLWSDFFTNPSKWLDKRKNKISNKSPDFVHKDTREALWINDLYTPAWVIPMLNDLQDEVFSSVSSTENMWKMLFADPSKWFDKRKIKKSRKYPDFKHKDTCEALWVWDLRTPTWVKPMLNNLHNEAFAATPSKEKRWQDLLADPSKWFDCRKFKQNNKLPDFKHKDTDEGLWIDNRVMSMLENLQDKAFASQDEVLALSTSTENLWRSLFDDPLNWFDNRKKKRNKNYPDFVHKYSGEALWINNITSPSWILPKLNGLTYLIIEDMWKLFFADPTSWVDKRIGKKSNKHPDFKHEDIGMALWIQGSKTPAWVRPMLNKLQSETFASSSSTENFQEAVFVDPSMWYDDKKVKISLYPPNFLHKRAKKVLGIESISTASIATAKLNKLQKDAFVHSQVLETSWSILFANPSKWYDKRTTKKDPKVPDFKHRDTYKGLWIDSDSTPAWVVPLLSKLGNEAFAPGKNADKKLEFLFVDPSIWFYNKNKEEDESAGEFTSSENQEIIQRG